MAKRANTPRTKGGWLAFFSFVAVMLLGLSLAINIVLVTWVPGMADLAAWIKNIAIAIALIVPLIYSYDYARRQSKTWFILWVIAVILIIVFYSWGILPL